jgi:hypothetical protein
MSPEGIVAMRKIIRLSFDGERGNLVWASIQNHHMQITGSWPTFSDRCGVGGEEEVDSSAK